MYAANAADVRATRRFDPVGRVKLASIVVDRSHQSPILVSAALRWSAVRLWLRLPLQPHSQPRPAVTAAQCIVCK